MSIFSIDGHISYRNSLSNYCNALVRLWIEAIIYIIFSFFFSVCLALRLLLYKQWQNLKLLLSICNIKNISCIKPAPHIFPQTWQLHLLSWHLTEALLLFEVVLNRRSIDLLILQFSLSHVQRVADGSWSQIEVDQRLPMIQLVMFPDQ